MPATTRLTTSFASFIEDHLRWHAAAFARLTPPTRMEPIDFPLRGEHITLDGAAEGQRPGLERRCAKALIAGGGVRVNGEPEKRRGRKLRAGDVVAVGDGVVHVRSG